MRRTSFGRVELLGVQTLEELGQVLDQMSPQDVQFLVELFVE